MRFSAADTLGFIGTKEPVFFRSVFFLSSQFRTPCGKQGMEAREWEVGGKEGSYLKNNYLLMNFS